MHEHVRAAAVLRDEAEAFLTVEELHGTSRHSHLLETLKSRCYPRKPFARASIRILRCLGMSPVTGSLPGSYFDAETAARSYEQHVAVWEEMDRLGYDGVGLNEHHTTPHGLMNSPNMMAAAGAQRTKKLKFFILGNLLPLHNPLRIAEELAMADCISRGRIMAGFARGVPREYKVFDVPMAEARARLDEALAAILKAWTEKTFTHEGLFRKLQD